MSAGFAGIVENVAGNGSGWIGTAVKFAASFIGVFVVISGLLKGWDHVDQGQGALKRRFGRVLYYQHGPKTGQPKVIFPGFRLLVPFMHSLWKINVQIRTRPLVAPTREINGFYFQVTSVIRFQVVDVFLALTMSEDLDAQIIAICEKHYCGLVIGKTPYELIPHELMARASPEAAALGVQLVELCIVNIAPSEATQLAMSWRAAGNLLTLPVPVILNGNNNGHGAHTPAAVA